MSSSNSIPTTTKAEIQPTCHFMRLPTEVREMIYRPLVIARYAMVERRMNSREYKNDFYSILRGPDQEYRFDTAILATNRRIYDEVRDLCRRQNNFVCLTSMQPSLLGFECEVHGLQIIAKYSKARNFKNISMTLTLDPPDSSGWPRNGSRWSTDVEDPPEDGRPWTYVFCSDDLPEFCRILLDMHRNDLGPLKETTLYIDISSAITNGQVKAIDDHPAGRGRMERLLGPLRQLHSLGACQIDGPLTGSYKGEIIRSICKHCPTAMDVVHETIALLEQADKQVSKSQFRHANLGYKAALSLLRSCWWQHQEQDFVMSDGPFPGLEVCKVVDNLMVRLHARIAAVYYKSNELRMARIYTERALDPQRAFDRRDRIYKLVIQPWKRIVYAEVLHVAAMISYTHGEVNLAVSTLAKAGEYAPFDEAQTARLDDWHGHADRLTAKLIKKYKARERQCHQQNEKVIAMFEVMCNWKRKGERLFRSGRPHLAASVYQTALNKLELLDRNHNLDFQCRAKTFDGLSAGDARKVLAFKLRACLAAANLKSRHYKEVVAQTGSALKCEDKTHDLIYHGEWYTNCSHSYSDYIGSYAFENWAEDQRPEYLRIHYCRAMALYHLGDTVTAAEHMEEAFRLDPGDNHVFEKLTVLKEELAEEAARKRKLRLEKLNSSQIQLQKKQARRRMKT